ncbi:MAG: hypothetical protein KIS62_05875 [Ramlibacter sp.]|nr:hypothetical protein [Ramlibacter sp.]MBX3657318.1 hypothetical protein [Ramlibacter sp.]MCW5649250.1 hypothetical protein [Ramlibacter sp.]
MKQYLNTLMVCAATLASAAAMVFGEPAKADLLLASAATQMASSPDLFVTDVLAGSGTAGQ